MKNFLINLILFIIMFALIGAIVILCIIMYNNFTSDDLSGTIYTISSSTIDFDKDTERNTNTLIQNIQDEENNLIVENFTALDEINVDNVTSQRFFYHQLTDTQKKIYDGLLENKENMRDGKYKIQYGSIFTDILKNEGGNELIGRDYQSAVETFLYDNPDVFYIDANKLFLSVETTSTLLKKTYNVYIGPANNSTYYAEGFESSTQVNKAINNMEILKEKLLSKLSGNSYKDVIKVHDYIVEGVDYDKDYSSKGRYNLYGALIDKKCVCEGYAKSLKYLLDAANIPCIIIQGSAINSSGKTESHAWNAVCLDNKWYYIDATWDDPIIIGSGHVAKSVQYKYFLKGAESFEKDHIPSYTFSDGGRTYKYPSIYEDDYK